MYMLPHIQCHTKSPSIECVVILEREKKNERVSADIRITEYQKGFDAYVTSLQQLCL